MDDYEYNDNSTNDTDGRIRRLERRVRELELRVAALKETTLAEDLKAMGMQ